MGGEMCGECLRADRQSVSLCVCDAKSSAAVTQTAINIILCVVSCVTAGAGSYLRDTHLVCVCVSPVSRLASFCHLPGQVASL